LKLKGTLFTQDAGLISIVIDKQGNLFVADYNKNTIHKIANVVIPVASTDLYYRDMERFLHRNEINFGTAVEISIRSTAFNLRSDLCTARTDKLFKLLNY